MRILISLIVGLLLSALATGVVLTTDGAGGIWHQLRDIFIDPRYGCSGTRFLRFSYPSP